MNKISNLLVLLLLISFILPAVAIKHASGSTDNDTSSSGETSSNNKDTTSSGESSDNNKDSILSSNDSAKSKDSSSGESSDNNNISSASGESTKDKESSSSVNSVDDNKTASSVESIENNNTGNIQQQSSSTGNTTTSNGSTANNNTENASSDFIKTILDIHNRERAAVSVAPLVWNDTLAADAKTYAEHLIDTGKFEHPNAEWVTAHPMSPEGENLAAGTTDKSSTALAQMAEGWVNEKKNYHGEPGDFNGVGHYTQMVWKGTTQVGCATASGKGGDILDCRYTPPGNYLGQKPY